MPLASVTFAFLRVATASPLWGGRSAQRFGPSPRRHVRRSRKAKAEAAAAFAQESFGGHVGRAGGWWAVFLDAAAVILVTMLSVSPAYAQTAPAPAAPSPTQYMGADRMQRLIAGAKREGSVSVYSSLPVDVMGQISAAFQRKYGVRANVWRGGSEEILQRTVTEGRGGRHTVDIVESAAAEIEAVDRERLLQPVRSPVLADLTPGSVARDRAWVTSRLIVFVAAYNSNLVRAADAPKRYEDLLDPKWRGKLTIEVNDANWLMGLSDALGKDRTMKLFRDVVARNGISVRNGHGLITNMLASGEVPLTFTQYYEQAFRAKSEGAPIGISYLNPVIAVPTGLAVLRRAPHPHAAMLYLDFYLTDGQKILADNHYVPANRKYQRLPAGMNLVIADMSKYVDEFAEWRRTFQDVFSARRR